MTFDLQIVRTNKANGTVIEEVTFKAPSLADALDKVRETYTFSKTWKAKIRGEATAFLVAPSHSMQAPNSIRVAEVRR